MKELNFEYTDHFNMGMLLAMDGARYVCKGEFRDNDKPLRLTCNKSIIRITDEIHERFCKLIQSWKRPEGFYWYKNKGFLLGKNKKNEVVCAEEIDEAGRSCASFITFNKPQINKAAMELMRQNTSPCGFARVSSYPCQTFNNNHAGNPFYWDKSELARLETTYYANYTPTGPEFFYGDSYEEVVPYQIIKVKKSKQISKEAVLLELEEVKQ